MTDPFWEELGCLRAKKQQEVCCVAFSPDGQTLVSGSGELFFWNVSFEESQARASFVAARNLTQQEWRRYLGNEPHRLTSPHAALSEANRLALEGSIRKAEEAFEELVKWSIKTKSPELNNVVGWYGTVHGFPNVVSRASDEAVLLSSTGKEPYYLRIPSLLYRDTRALNRALTGDTAGAIEDLEVIVGWYKQQASATPSESWIMIREKWLRELEAGRNPFDAATLKELLRE